MITLRQDIRGTTPQDILRINENFMNIGQKLSGNIDFEDTTKETQDKINTQWIPVQGEGNLDKNYPLYIRFFIPPNAKLITGSSFNMLLENYRMDSNITSTEPMKTYAQTQTSTEYPGSTETSTAQPQITSSTTSNGGGTTSTPSVSITSTSNSDSIDLRGVYTGLNSGSGSHVHDIGLLLTTYGHSHDITHTHSVTYGTHSHDITIQPHSHNVTIKPHTHNISFSFDVPSHTHSINPGIYVSTSSPENVEVTLNDTKVSDLTSSGIQLQDWTGFIKIGQWNIIKVTTTNFARAILYGTIEVVVN